MKNSMFKDNIAPALVLVIICLVVGFALAGTYSAANPVIQKNAQITADKTRSEVLPKGDSFTKYDGKLTAGITECYVSDNKAGMVVTATSKSFGGTMTAMIGIGADGKITGVKVTNHADTPGLGTKAMTVEYLQQYVGKDEVKADHIKNDGQTDAITGATISSNGVYQNVKEALRQFEECGGVK